MSNDERRLTRLETLVGETPDSGVRGDLKRMDKQIGTLFSLFRGLEKRIYLAIGGAAVVLWLLNLVATPLVERLVHK